MQWNGTGGPNGTGASALAPAASVLSVDAEVWVTDTFNMRDILNQTSMVTVSITGGTATGATIDGGAGPVVLTMVDGKASVLAAATSTGTIILGLSAPSPAGLNVADVLTITLS
jgi:hypothetical protein